MAPSTRSDVSADPTPPALAAELPRTRPKRRVHSAPFIEVTLSSRSQLDARSVSMGVNRASTRTRQSTTRNTTIVHLDPAKDNADAAKNADNKDSDATAPTATNDSKKKRKLAVTTVDEQSEVENNAGAKATRGRARKSRRTKKSSSPTADKTTVVKKEAGQPLRRSTRAAAAVAATRISQMMIKRPAAVKVKTESKSPNVRQIPKGKTNDNLADKEWKVEAIVNQRKGKSRGTEYLVKWVGFPASKNTWEPAANLSRCRDMIAQFTAGLKGSKGKK